MTLAVRIEIHDDVPTGRRNLLRHAAAVWAASRGVHVSTEATVEATIVIGGGSPLALPVGEPQATPSWIDGLPFIHSSDRGPDHLSEIGMWVSAAAERNATLDAIGRVPYAASTPASLGVDPTIPWASRHLDALDSQLVRRLPALAHVLERRRTGVTVLGSHDIDFVARSRSERARRLIANLGVASIAMRDPRLTTSIGTAAVGNVARRRPLLGTPELVAAIESRHGIRSTWNVLCRRAHPRDANYELDDEPVRRLLDQLATDGHEIGLHGSYTVGASPDGIADEFGRLEAAGHHAVGHRHHWLRHDGFSLWSQLDRAGAGYDSSAGWADAVGFRHGMAEPFVPFDLTTGAAASVVEVPLVMMDVALSDAERQGQNPAESAHRILDEAARHGGAVSILWHDTTVLDTQVRRGIGGLYESLMTRGDTWAVTAEAAEAARNRSRDAGLLDR